MRKENSKHIKLIVTFLLIGIIVMISGLLFLRLHNGIIVKAEQRTSFLDEVTAYRQDDTIWSDELLGKSSFTMESSGCLVTCIASAMSMEGEEEITPGELNKIFTDNNVYDSEGNIQWSEIEKIDGYSVIVYDKVSEAEMYQCLEKGHYPIVRVRMNGIGNYHYVLIVGIEDEDYICMDPLKNGLTKLSDYWNIVYAVRLVYAS